VLENFIEGLSNVCRSVVHDELKLPHDVVKEGFSASGDGDVLHPSEGDLSDFRVLMLQVAAESIHCSLHVVASVMWKFTTQGAGEGGSLLLHFRVGVLCSLGDHVGDWSQVLLELLLIGVQTDIEEID